ncbi:MAG: class I SAM-dependent methyltransferase [Gammaproteobacteria bacterium]
MHVDEQKLNTFLQHAIDDLSASYGGVMVSLGHKLGLYQTMAGAGRQTASQIADKAGCARRYVQEWLNSQVAGGYAQYNREDATYELTPEQAVVLADSNSPFFIANAWNIAASMWFDEEKSLATFQTGDGLRWDQHDDRLFCGVSAFFRNGYQANLVDNWLPTLDGVVAKLEKGIKVADIGCGHGYSTIIMAKAFPHSEFYGFDYHQGSIDQARDNAVDEGVSERVHFEVAHAKNFPGNDYGLICLFDCLHDMGDPIGAARYSHNALAVDGSVMLVEPYAGDRVEDNINPIGRLYYSASTTMCCAHSLSEEVGLALGAQAGEKRLAEIFTQAGFSHFQRTTETPFNLVLEARS